MSEETPSRRPFRLREEPVEAADTPQWTVKLANGEERGPLSVSALRALREVSLLDSTAEVRGENGEWLPIADHPLWPMIADARPTLRLRARDTQSPLPAAPIAPPPSQAPTNEMQARLDAAQRAEYEKLNRQLRWHSAGRALWWVRELFIFFLFFTAADFANSFVSEALGAARWIIGLFVVLVALLYYIMLGFGK